MTFVNPMLLWALAGVAVPILIHLLHRRRATDVDWGAMRFLLAGVARHNRRVRFEEWLLLAVRCGLIALVVLAVARPFLRQRQIIGQTAGAQDVVIVIDASLSMTASVEDLTNFQRAIAEARRVLGACRPGDAVALILAGPTVRAVLDEPSSDLAAVDDALDRLTPTAGAMRPLEALDATTTALAAGHNTAKRIVVITDGQAAGWDVAAERRWRYLADGLAELPTAPIVLIRTLGAPADWTNLAVGRLAADRAIIGADRAMVLSARITNTGARPATPGDVVLRVDGVAQPAAAVSEPIAPGAAETVALRYTFSAPGRHLLTVRLTAEDDLPGDNLAACVVNVQDKLDVLVVDGAPARRPLAGQSDFLRIALTRSAGADRPALIAAKVVDAADLPAVGSLAPYAVVVLANVPRLPQAVAGRLAEYVHRGGGLLVAPGGLAQPDFYNTWLGGNGEPLLPARLDKAVDDAAGAARPAAGGGGALAKALAPDAYDFARLTVRRHWRLVAHEGADVAAALENGDPLAVLRPVGAGRVAMLAVPADDDWSNLVGLDCFTPLAHELTYTLAGARGGLAALRPGQRWMYQPGGDAADEDYKVIAPDGRSLRPTIRHTDAGPQITFDRTYTPGLYRLVGPDNRETPFVVAGDEDESVLTSLTDADLAALGRYADIRRVTTTDQLVAAVSGGTPGVEIWSILVAAAIAAAALEVLLARWIATRRRMDRTEGVAFAEHRESPEIETAPRRRDRPSRPEAVQS